MKELLVETDYHVPTVGGFNLQTLKKVNPLAAWADECLILEPTAETPVGNLTEYTRTKRISDSASESETIIDHADDWLYPSYVRWCRGRGNKHSSSVTFTGLIKDLLCHQLKLEGIEKLDRAGAKLSRFRGIRLRTDEDLNLGNLLSLRYGLVRVRYGFGTGCIDQSTGSTEKTKFSTSDVSAPFFTPEAETMTQSESAHKQSWEKNSTDSVQPVPPVPIQQNQELTEAISVPNPYRPVPDGPQPVPDGLEAPPDPGPGYLESLLIADEPVSHDRHCNDYRNLDPCRAGCRFRVGVISMEQRATPPCNGADFEPKEERHE